MMERMVVVLPMPLRPRIATVVPLGTLSERSHKTWVSP